MPVEFPNVMILFAIANPTVQFTLCLRVERSNSYHNIPLTLTYPYHAQNHVCLCFNVVNRELDNNHYSELNPSTTVVLAMHP